ncbi:SLAC1 anion channel family protein [Pontibacterium granulatum]|uniref:SLAC1 anion channel family protein n=1 Tax=Pontibacterium granulatum TaxID=2036029 RepID=UPI00249CBD1D|nr:SLAC1 anion channel family protein [Pontibacterium granulatum]MDI3322803.1 SLAC1 anion channel family protein [Pontibacterium granulatum]
MADTATSSSPVSAKLPHFPIAFFAMIMGTSGLTLAWQKATEVLQLPALVSQVMLILVTCLFLVVCLGYALKILRFPEMSLKEFHHPIKISFFPAFSISLLLLSVATLQVSADLSLFLWALGCVMHLGFTLYVITQWIHHPKFQIQHSTPAWFIPVVGNIIVPIAGVTHGFTELSWFFFSIGLVYWLVLKTLIFNRMLFHDPLPEKLLPTLFILIAPPAVGFISYTKLNGGEIDGFARILFYSAMFLVLLLITQLERFRRIPFFLSWWAYSFPLAASSIAIQTMYQKTGSSFLGLLSWVSLMVVSLVIALLLFKTFKAVHSGGVFQPD